MERPVLRNRPFPFPRAYELMYQGHCEIRALRVVSMKP